VLRAGGISCKNPRAVYCVATPLDVGARPKKFRCPEPEPQLLVPTPQPWYAKGLQALSLLCDVRYSTMEKLSC